MNHLKHVMQRLCQLAFGCVPGQNITGEAYFCTALKRVAQKRGGCLSTGY